MFQDQSCTALNQNHDRIHWREMGALASAIRLKFEGTEVLHNASFAEISALKARNSIYYVV